MGDGACDAWVGDGDCGSAGGAAVVAAVDSLALEDSAALVVSLALVDSLALADSLALEASSALVDSLALADSLASVSYTHLTLPTILLV